MRRITVQVEPLARDKMLTFASAVQTEIGGLLRVRLEGRTLIVSDAWTVPQEVTGGSVDFEPGHFEDDLKAQGYITGKPMPWICMGIWHSHAHFGVGMSGTDEEHLVRKYAMRGYLVNIVVNRKGEWHCQVDTMVGPEAGRPDDYVLVTVPSELAWTQAPGVLDTIQAEIIANVKARPQIVLRGHKYGEDSAYSGGNGVDDEEWWREGRPRREAAKAAWKDVPAADPSQWVFDNKSKGLVERDKHTGRVLRTVAQNGATTFYDKHGRPIAVTKDNRTSLPRHLAQGLFKGRG
jgi:hypothetical protein